MSETFCTFKTHSLVTLLGTSSTRLDSLLGTCFTCSTATRRFLPERCCSLNTFSVNSNHLVGGKILETLTVAEVTFLHCSDAHFKLRQLFFIRSICINAPS